MGYELIKNERSKKTFLIAEVLDHIYSKVFVK
jgi:hypothetical protein